MSTINKKPFIKKLLDSMSGDDLVTLQGLMDGEGVQTPLLRTLNIRPFGNRSHITEADLGVHLCNLEIGTNLFLGYLVFNKAYCVLLQFTDFQRIQMFKIVSDKLNYEVVDEYLDINELRSELDDKEESISPSGGAEIVSILSMEDMQTKITYDNLIKPVVEEQKEVILLIDLGLAQGQPNGLIAYYRSSLIYPFPTQVWYEFFASPLDIELDPALLSSIIFEFDGSSKSITSYNFHNYSILTSSQTDKAINRKLANEYNDFQTYNTGDVVWYESELYQCIEDNVSGSFDGAKWQATNIASAVLGLLNTGV